MWSSILRACYHWTHTHIVKMNSPCVHPLAVFSMMCSEGVGEFQDTHDVMQEAGQEVPP